MKKIGFILIISASFLMGSSNMIQATPYKYVKASLQEGKSQFVEVGSEHCYACQIMGKMLYSVKRDHPNYRISFVNVKKERYAARELKIRLIPTQIIFDEKGKEVYRHIGILKAQKLEALLKQYHIGE